MVELLCTLTGIIAGVTVVACILHQHGERARFEAKPPDENPERIQGIADQLQMISHRVAANVSAHTEKVEHFGDSIENSENGQSEQLLSAIDKIIQANASMQGQLADAQKRIVQQSEMIEQASQQARTDALTGLANRRALDEFLSNCIGSASSTDVIGVLLMDIDHFKNFNDSFGHTTGDAVLASFARSIAKIAGAECYAARFGGEEFAVVLTGATPDNLAEKSAAIRRYVSEQVISYEDLQLKITASAGLCVCLPDDTIHTVYERSDEGLYQSKKAGRNQGFWLSEAGWTPFPKVPDSLLTPSEAPPKAPSQQPASPDSASAADQPEEGREIDATGEKEGSSPKTAGQKSKDKASTSRSKEEAKSQDKEPATSPTEILDLNAFLSRLEPYLEQLRRAELPMVAIMVEAIGLPDADEKASQESWTVTVGLIQLSLRGIDVVCQFRSHTLCIFMPGCSHDAALDRAAKIQASLADSRDTWQTTACPERLAVSIASVETTEDSSQFLDRLESALDEAADATDSQVVVHDGQATHFQDV